MYEPPAAIQNAMMTKDKKPFTYTPGGLDLSQIRSPRMQRRITRNANAEGVSDQPQVGTISPLTRLVSSFLFSLLKSKIPPCPEIFSFVFYGDVPNKCRHCSSFI